WLTAALSLLFCSPWIRSPKIRVPICPHRQPADGGEPLAGLDTGLVGQVLMGFEPDLMLSPSPSVDLWVWSRYSYSLVFFAFFPSSKSKTNPSLHYPPHVFSASVSLI